MFSKHFGEDYYATVADEDVLRQEFDNVSSYHKFPADEEFRSFLFKREEKEKKGGKDGCSSSKSKDESLQQVNFNLNQKRYETLKCIMDRRMKRAYALPRGGLSAPFSEREIRVSLGIREEALSLSRRHEQRSVTRATIPTFAMEPLQDMPFYYGNCLSLLPNRARSKMSLGRPNTNVVWLFYSKGQSLAVSPIDFGQEVVHHNQNQNHKQPHNGHPRRHSICNSNKVTQVDVGARIMQVQGCFDAHSFDTIPEKTLMIVRTCKDCVVVECDRKARGQLTSCCDTSESDMEESELACTDSCHLTKIATLSYHDSDGNGMEPIHVATRQQNSTMYGGSMLPTFATLCKSTTDLVMGEYGPCIIYHTTCNGDDIQSQRHDIVNVASISQIHFSHMHPMVLWSAARSKKNHELYLGKAYYRRPTIGFGHSLHSIDLRSDKASFVWSQSEDEYMPENMHSISGILVDECNPFSLYVSSYSSGKMYHVDARMPARTLCSWHLPGICSEERMYNSPSGIYGSGSLLTKPILGSGLKNSSNVPILGVSKEPNAFGFHLYQKPSNLAHFQTRNLEKVAGHGLDPTGTFAESSFFALPVVSESVFTTGIAAFYQPLNCLVDDVNSFKYDYEHEFALCVICANSLGNLYSYTLAAYPQDKEGKALPVTGGPLGSCAVPIPKAANRREQIIHDNPTTALCWTLDNSYPNHPDTKHEPYELPPTQYEVLDAIRTSQMSTRISRKRVLELTHPNPRMQFGPLNKSPPQRRSLVAYLPSQKSKGNIRRSRSYPIKKPCEDLQNIVSKLRAKQYPQVESSG
jgi:hypothetical protein